MSAEPKLPRWSEASSEAPEELRALLREGRAPLGAPEQVAQLAQGLEHLLAPMAGLSAAGLAAPAARVGFSFVRWAAWAAIGLSSAAALWYFSAEPAKLPAPSAPPPAVSTPPTPAAREPVVEPPAELAPAPAPAPEPAVAAPLIAKPPVAARAARGSSEAELLRRAQSVLTASPEQALALTAEHQRRFGAGSLTEEREALAIEALRRLGRLPEAQRRAAAFAKRYPHSVHASRVRGSAPTAPAR